jgi:hypothetical protein
MSQTSASHNATLMQPATGSQVSAVQGFLSSQFAASGVYTH